MRLTRSLLQLEYAPSHFVLHAGDNDVGRISFLDLCNKVNGTEGIINELQRLMPLTVSHFSYAPLFQGPQFLTKMLESNILYDNLFIDI